LKTKFVSEPTKFSLAAADLALEAQFLASLSHPHILRIHGWSIAGLDSYAEYGNNQGYFLVLDRLHMTLDKKINLWKKEELTSRFEQLVSFAERTKVAYQIASALEYLHENNVIFRDLKPSNVGFDENGDVKLFDFGLARELPGKSCETNDVYRMSGKIGTLRYMAPECALQNMYNLKADVYTWSLVYYHMMSLQKPYEGYGTDLHLALVCKLGDRPHVDNEWPIMVQDLMERGWAQEISERPTMMDVCFRLQAILDDYELESRELIMQSLSDMPEELGRQESIVLELPEGFNSTKKETKFVRSESFTAYTNSMSEYS